MNDNGGLAFPVPTSLVVQGGASEVDIEACQRALQQAYAQVQGMTVRQAYKMAALQETGFPADVRPEEIARAVEYCSKVADAMLAEDREFEAKQETKGEGDE